MYHLMGKIKESQYAKLCILLAFCCITVFIYINTNGQTKTNPKVESMSIANDDFADEMMTGGLSQVRERDDEVSEVVNKIKPTLEERSGRKFESLEVVHYRPQIVAGKNYFVKAKALVEGVEQVLHLRIYRDLKGQLDLTAFQLDRKLGEELGYFQ